MSPNRRDRTRPVPPELQRIARDLLEAQGTGGAAAELGVSKAVVLRVAAGAGVLPDSLALLREAVRRRVMA